MAGPLAKLISRSMLRRIQAPKERATTSPLSERAREFMDDDAWVDAVRHVETMDKRLGEEVLGLGLQGHDRYLLSGSRHPEFVDNDFEGMEKLARHNFPYLRSTRTFDVHNHPGQLPIPSGPDLSVYGTKQFQQVLGVDPLQPSVHGIISNAGDRPQHLFYEGPTEADEWLFRNLGNAAYGLPNQEVQRIVDTGAEFYGITPYEYIMDMESPYDVLRLLILQKIMEQSGGRMSRDFHMDPMLKELYPMIPEYAEGGLVDKPIPEVTVTGQRTRIPDSDFVARFIEQALDSEAWNQAEPETGVVDLRGVVINDNGVTYDVEMPHGVSAETASQLLQAQGVPKHVANRYAGVSAEGFAGGGLIKLGAKKGAKELMERLRSMLQENPFDPRELHNNEAAMEVYPLGDRARLSAIRTLDPGKGNASRLLKQLTDLADELGVELELTASPFYTGATEGKGLDEKQLIEWYKRHGFEDGGFSYSDDMVRKPRPKGFAAGGLVKPVRQWLKGTIEKALQPYKKGSLSGAALEDSIKSYEDLIAGRRTQVNDPTLQQNMLDAYRRNLEREKTALAVNKWLDSNMKNYLRRDFGTEWDPLREVFSADEGLVSRQELVDRYIVNRDEDPEFYDSIVNSGDVWGDILDMLETRSPINRRTAGQIKQWGTAPPSYFQGDKEHWAQVLKENPWIEKLDPESMVEWIDDDVSQDMFDNLRFTHMFDELWNAVRPDSDLPENFRLRPDSLSRVSVPDAVRLTRKIGDWRAEQAKKATLEKANNPAVHTFKEYPEGFRWVELKKPEDTGNFSRIMEDPEEWGTVEDESIAHLREALKYEGDTMGHCVGGYCSDVADGRSKIFSLRGPDGEPHVTIETRPTNNDRLRQVMFRDYENAEDIGGLPFDKWIDANRSKYTDIPDSIVQIKGKGNKAPVEKYLPFVQDFVRGGKWSSVGDLQNTGLIDFKGAETRVAGKKVRMPEGYMTRSEASKFLQDQGVPAEDADRHTGNIDHLIRGMKQGGLVTQAYDPARIDSLANDLRSQIHAR